jgi:DNA-binding NarL/FixJ family response regulator
MLSRRIVIVDDEQDIRELLTMWLRDDPRCDWIGEAEDVPSAISLVEHERPDAVLLDFFLGRQLCVDALPAIRSACPDAAIVVYTASRRAAESADVLGAGADLVVEKGTVSVDDVVELLLGSELRPRVPSRRYAGDDAAEPTER